MSIGDDCDFEIRDALERAPEFAYPPQGVWIDHDGGAQPIPDDQPIQYRERGLDYPWCAYSDNAPWDRITSFMVEEWTGDFVSYSGEMA